MKSILWAVCLLALVRPGTDLSAQVNPYKDGTPGVSGYRSEVLAEVMIQEDKFLRLAEAVPADKYTWRPAPDVRSFAEVFLHVSAANYNIYKLVGTPPPTGVDVKGLEKSHHRQGEGDCHAQGFVRARTQGDHRYARRRPRQEPGLVRWKEHGTWPASVCRSPCRRAPRPVNRLCAFHRSGSAVDRRRAEAAETKTRDRTQGEATIIIE